MNDQIRTPPSDDEDSLRDLLREAGARETLPADVVNEVRHAVYDEWRQMVRQRRRARVVRYGLAASGLVAIVAVLLMLQPMQLLSGEPIATVARIDGSMQMTVDGTDTWQPVLPGASLRRGTMLRTADDSRVALDLQGLSVRIDSNSRVELGAADRITLDTGALYVDAASATAGAQPLTVDTLYGSVRHVGTQYALQTRPGALAIAVREGRVEIQHQGSAHAGAAGEYIVIRRDGELQREAISSQDPRWQWATSIAPVFPIEGRPLTEFLDWAARETGKPVAYVSPEVRARAGRLLLRGSVGNLPPEQALAAVLATTPFTQTQSEESIRIGL